MDGRKNILTPLLKYIRCLIPLVIHLCPLPVYPHRELNILRPALHVVDEPRERRRHVLHAHARALGQAQLLVARRKIPLVRHRQLQAGEQQREEQQQRRRGAQEITQSSFHAAYYIRKIVSPQAVALVSVSLL